MRIVVTTPTGHVGSRVVRLLVQAGLRPTVLRGDDLIATATDPTYRSRRVPVGRDGEATVVVTYRDDKGEVLARDTLMLPLRPRRTWLVGFGLLREEAATDPLTRCRGCDGERRVPLRGPSGLPGFTFLHVMWNADDPDLPPKPPA